MLHDFTGPDGAFPFDGLTQDSAGNMYGTTNSVALTIGERCLSFTLRRCPDPALNAVEKQIEQQFRSKRT